MDRLALQISSTSLSFPACLTSRISGYLCRSANNVKSFSPCSAVDFSAPSTSINSRALVLCGTSSGRKSLTTLNAVLSIYSRVFGRIPLLRISETRSVACCRLSVNTRKVLVWVGKASSLTIILLTTPNVPSEPIKRRVKSYPTTPLAVLTPVCIRRPSGKITSRPST